MTRCVDNEPVGHRIGEMVDKSSDPRARIREIQWMMAQGKWVRGKSGRDLAAQWGVPNSTIRSWSAEASRALDMIGDRDAIEAMCRVRLTEIVNDPGADPAQAIRTLLQNIGRLTEKHEVSVDHLTVEQHEAQLTALLDRPDPMTARVLAQLGYARAPQLVESDTCD